MKIGDYLKKTAATLVPGGIEATLHREQAAARAAWEAQLLEAQRAFREKRGPAVRVPMPRFLGLPWPPPPLPSNTTVPTAQDTRSDE